MTTTNDAGISFDRILFYASCPAGLQDGGEAWCAGTRRRVKALEAEGKIEMRERTVDLPEVNMPESCKAVAMFDTWSARTVVIRTWHTVA